MSVSVSLRIDLLDYLKPTLLSEAMSPLYLLILLVPYSSSLPEGFVYTGDLDLNVPILVSLRYGTRDNFVGDVVRGYENIPSRGAVVTAEAGDALVKAQTEFLKDGYGIVIYDSYRPTRAVDHFMEWAEDDKVDEELKGIFYPNVEKSNLFDLGYIASRSGHSRGSTIDRNISLSLTPNPFAFQVEIFTF